MNTPFTPSVVHDPRHQRFEMESGQGKAILKYSLEGNRISFDHTHVPEALRGKGIGTALVRAAMIEARLQRWRILARCSFVADFLRTHPEFSDLV